MTRVYKVLMAVFLPTDKLAVVRPLRYKVANATIQEDSYLDALNICFKKFKKFSENTPKDF